MKARHALRIVLVLLGTVGLSVWINAASAAVDCDAEFAAIVDNANGQSSEAMIAKWRSLEQQCGGTGQYELRLGAMYTLANKDKEARNVLTRGLNAKSAYAKDIQLSLFDLDLRQGRLEEAERGATALVAEFSAMARWTSCSGSGPARSTTLPGERDGVGSGQCHRGK